MVATSTHTETLEHHRPFSPLFVGAMVATMYLKHYHPVEFTFSPLFVGAMVATEMERREKMRRDLSVPFSSGQWLLPNSRV